MLVARVRVECRCEVCAEGNRLYCIHAVLFAGSSAGLGLVQNHLASGRLAVEACSRALHPFYRRIRSSSALALLNLLPSESSVETDNAALICSFFGEAFLYPPAVSCGSMCFGKVTAIIAAWNDEAASIGGYRTAVSFRSGGRFAFFTNMALKRRDDR